ncbi:thioredoxin family protein [Sulfuriflexus mobilis]|uniref:thioredoxin family protein n=1 Tax=Sulfuriflexus mobilis TaxID=1811807 RepID=UPI0015588F79|nr:thioredoxin fold domain-containing protein [Sulfuriflexus mobilis]
MLKKLFTTLLMAGCGLFLLSSLQAAEVEIPVLHNLQADSQISQQRQLPMVVLFSATYCSYCRIIKEEFLKPMLISGEYTDKAMIRVIEVDSNDDLVDLNGQPISAEDFAFRYDISLTPTLVFFDARGNELAKRMVGVTTVDYYGSYLDAAIGESRQRLHATRQLALNP